MFQKLAYSISSLLISSSNHPLVCGLNKLLRLLLNRFIEKTRVGTEPLGETKPEADHFLDELIEGQDGEVDAESAG